LRGGYQIIVDRLKKAAMGGKEKCGTCSQFSYKLRPITFFSWQGKKNAHKAKEENRATAERQKKMDKSCWWWLLWTDPEPGDGPAETGSLSQRGGRDIGDDSKRWAGGGCGSSWVFLWLISPRSHSNYTWPWRFSLRFSFVLCHKPTT